MKALILKAYNELAYTDAPDPQPGPDDVLVRVKACGICGSDVHGLDGSTGRRVPPLIMGHEAAGVIEAVGGGVRDWRPGDRVTFDSTIYCGECRFCRRGRINLCDNRRVLGVSCAEYRQHGAFAQYVAVPARILYRLPDDLAFERAALVEPVAIALHAARRAGATLNDSAVVVGAGVIGLLAVQVLRAAGCTQVIAVDIDEGRLELARRMGAEAVESSPGVAARVAERTGGLGADVVIEAAGIPESVGTAMACVRKGGTVALVGNLAAEAALPLQAVVTREVRLLGSCASCGEYGECLDMMARGAVDVGPLISAVAPLSDGAAWFGRLYEREAGLIKVVLRP